MATHKLSDRQMCRSMCLYDEYTRSCNGTMVKCLLVMPRLPLRTTAHIENCIFANTLSWRRLEPTHACAPRLADGRIYRRRCHVQSHSIKHAGPKIVQPEKKMVSGVVCTMARRRFVYFLVDAHIPLRRCFCHANSECRIRCVCSSDNAVCDASHQPYLLLHFVTICDLCSYEFSKDPFNVAQPHRHNPNFMKNCCSSLFSLFHFRYFVTPFCAPLSPWDLGNRHNGADCFFTIFLKIEYKRISSFLLCIRAASSTCVVCSLLLLSYTLCIGIYPRREGEINEKANIAHSERIMRKECVAHPMALCITDYSIYHNLFIK